ncbi:MAG: hypothetical protein RL459_1479 [Pseudomonadota bacterium]|jgi:hypothetical protein
MRKLTLPLAASQTKVSFARQSNINRIAKHPGRTACLTGNGPQARRGAVAGSCWGAYPQGGAQAVGVTGRLAAVANIGRR